MIKLNNVEISQEDLIKEITGNKELMATLQSKFGKQDSGWFVPEGNERYWYLGAEIHSYTKTGDLDEKIIARQQVFRTAEEAKKADQQRIAKVRILKRIAEENEKEGWVCDWEDGKSKYVFLYQHRIDKLELSFSLQYQEVETGFYMSETVAEKLQTELLQDYKIMLGVE